MALSWKPFWSQNGAAQQETRAPLILVYYFADVVYSTSGKHLQYCRHLTPPAMNAGFTTGTAESMAQST